MSERDWNDVRLERGIVVIRDGRTGMMLGAGATVSEAWRSLVADEPESVRDPQPARVGREP